MKPHRILKATLAGLTGSRSGCRYSGCCIGDEHSQAFGHLVQGDADLTGSNRRLLSLYLSTGLRATW